MKKNKIAKCEKCETIRGTKERHQCPYEAGLNENEAKDHCNCCRSCVKKCNKEITETLNDLTDIYREVYGGDYF